MYGGLPKNFFSPKDYSEIDIKRPVSDKDKRI
jgi:hypothetical protein